VPIALFLLEQDPYLEVEYYPTDLLMAVWSVPDTYWATHPAEFARLEPMLEIVRPSQGSGDAVSGVGSGDPPPTDPFPIVYFRFAALPVLVMGLVICGLPVMVGGLISMVAGSSDQSLLLGASLGALAGVVAMWWLIPSGRLTADHLEVPRILNFGTPRTLRRFPARGRRRLVPRSAVTGFRVGRNGTSVGIWASLRDNVPLDQSRSESGSLWLLTDARSFGLPRVDRVVQVCSAMARRWDLTAPEVDGFELRVTPDVRLLEQGSHRRTTGRGNSVLDLGPIELSVTTPSGVAVLPWSTIATIGDARVVEMGQPDRWMLRVDLSDGRATLLDRDYWGETGPSDEDLLWLVTLASHAGVICRITGVLNGVPMMSKQTATRMVTVLASLATDSGDKPSDP